ncbi:hypothetical protein B0T20DRAFT_473828 [Sordaria brevicollis]|uniref:Uncharacterized protein n=1 Tax=Sordaria brevicollis TaxID=83679 RepID=A0AAE0NVS2_SORBR|nr:hypothetical protein B0T20DRAFT_473828 [Sordaria brevicollis]
MISTSDLHLLGCHFEQYPHYQPQNLKSTTSKLSKEQQNTESNSGQGVLRFPLISFGFVFVLLGITCTITSIGIFQFLSRTHSTLNQDVNLATWFPSGLFSLSAKNKTVTDSLMGLALIESLRKQDFVNSWRAAMPKVEMKMKLPELQLEVEAMPFESAVLTLESFVYNVAGL